MTMPAYKYLSIQKRIWSVRYARQVSVEEEDLKPDFNEYKFFLVSYMIQFDCMYR